MFWEIVTLFLICIIIALNFALREMYKHIRRLMSEIDYMETRLKRIIHRNERRGEIAKVAQEEEINRR